jgi:hypothetical protein
MKNFLPTLILLLCGSMVFAQAPKGINYQGVARDNEGNALVSKTISVRVSILKNSANGEVEYAETHKPTTNQFGLFTLVIGKGTTTTGNFNFISWAIGNKWLQIEIDPNGGSAYTLAGSQQLMTVPYAFYAEYSGNSNLTAGQGIAITNGVVSNTGDNDKDPTNELQQLSEVLTRGNNAGGIKITNLGTPVAANDAATKSYVDAQHDLDLDKDPTNELQTLTQVLMKGNDAGGLRITNTGTPTAPTDAATKSYVDEQNDLDLDKDPANEIQTLEEVLMKGNDAGGLRITNAGTPTAPTDAATKSYVDALHAADLDQNAGNEIQDLVFNGATHILKITNNNSATDINLSAYRQSLTYTPSNNQLSISGSNSVTISTTLEQVLTNNADAAGKRIQNVGTPTANGDATTKLYVDNAIARNFAFKVKFDYTNTTGGLVLNQTMPLSATPETDEFNVLSSNSFTAQESGIYVFTVEGSYQYNLSSAPSLYLMVNGVQNPVVIVAPVGAGDPKYNSTFMFKLNAGQTAHLIVDLIPNNARFIGYFFGYKL